MKKLHWAGIIREGGISKYQNGNLLPKAVKMSMPSTMPSLMIKALPFAVLPFLILLASMLIKRHLYGHSAVSPLYVIIGFIIGFFCLIVHEILHGIIYPKEAEVYIGIYPKALSAVVMCSYPVTRARFILMSALPALILGAVPLAVFWLLESHCKILGSLLFGISIMGCISPYPDFYNIFQVIKQTPKKCRIQFWKDDIYFTDQTK